MRALLSVLLLSAAAAAEPAGPGALNPADELRLAERSMRDGLHELVALRMSRLLGSEARFEGRDRAELLLAQADYLGGRRESARKRLAAFDVRYPKSRWRDDRLLLNARISIEVDGNHGAAEKTLRSLLKRNLRSSLRGEVRYYLCLAIVERAAGSGRLTLLNDEVDGQGRLVRRGALSLLEQHIAGTEVLIDEAHVLLGRALYLSGRPEECFRRLQEFLELPGRGGAVRRAEALFWQGEARYGGGRWGEAAALYARAAETARKSASGSKEARALVERAGYNHGWALLKLAGEQRRAGLAEEKTALEHALRSFLPLVAAGGGDLAAASRLRAGEALCLLGRFEAERNRRKDAVLRFGEALKELAPLLDERLPRGGRTLRAAEAGLLSARAQTALGRYESAEELLGAAARAAAAGRRDASLLAGIHLARGENHFLLAGRSADRGKAVESAELLRKAARSFAEVSSPAGGRSGRVPAADAYLARLWSARTLARGGRLDEAVRTAAELHRTVPAAEALRRDRLAYYHGKFLLMAAREAETRADEEARRAAAKSAISLFAEAGAAGPQGRFAVPSMLGAAEANSMLNNDPQAATLYAAVRRHPLASDRQRILAELGVARTLQSGRRYRRAAEHVRAAVLEAKPEPDPRLLREALDILADCLEAIDEPAEAAEAYRRLAEVEAARDRTASVRAALRRAAQLVEAGKADAAARETVALLTNPPPSMLAEARFQAAVAHEAAGKIDGALKYFAAAAELPGELRGPALVRAAELEMAAGRWAPALANAVKALESCRPGRRLTARIHMIRGRALLAGARPGEAAACFRQAVDAARAQPASPAEEDPELEALLGLAGALRAQALALREKGRMEEALKPLSDAAAALAEAAYLRGESPDPELLERAAAVMEEAAAVMGQAGRKREASERKRAAAELRELAGRCRRERQ